MQINKRRMAWKTRRYSVLSPATRITSTIDCIYELATSNFEKYRWDDNFALVRKCCFALGDINTPKAKEKLELLLQSDEEMIRKHAMEQLHRCDFTNKDVE